MTGAHASSCPNCQLPTRPSSCQSCSNCSKARTRGRLARRRPSLAGASSPFAGLGNLQPDVLVLVWLLSSTVGTLNHGHPCNQHYTTTTWALGGGATATATCYYNNNNNNNNNNNKLTVPHRTHTVLAHSPTVPWSALVGLPWSASRTLIWTAGKQSFAGRVRAVTSGPPQCIFVPNATAGAACAWFCSATALLPLCYMACDRLQPPATTCN
jgi:hypothetical protein